MDRALKRTMVLKLIRILLRITFVWVMWLGSASAAADCLIVPFHSGEQTSRPNSTHYGNFKAGLFSYVSLESRTRYCRRFGLNCIIVPADDVAVGRSADQAKLSPRVSKLQHILAVLDERKECSRLVYLDTDIVITSLLQNVFDSSFFSTAAAGRAVALTYDLQWNATDVVPRPTSRYQTGVIFMQRSPLLVELLQAWLGQRKSERLEGSVARLRATGSAGKQQSAVSVADSEPWDSDQWLLSRLLVAQPAYGAAISTLKPRHEYNAFPVHRAGLRNSSSGSSSGGNTTERVSAMHRVRQQKEDAAAALWQQMRRPQGDEVPGESLLVHFAGVFGGADPETGVQDALSTLLAVRGFLARHLRVVEPLLQLPRQPAPQAAVAVGADALQGGARALAAANVTVLRGIGTGAGAGGARRGGACEVMGEKTDRDVVMVLRRLLTRADSCIGASFSAQSYLANATRTELGATVCLTEIARASRRLIGNSKRLETAVRRVKEQQRVTLSCLF